MLERADPCHRLLHPELHELGAEVVVANRGARNLGPASGDLHSRKAVTWRQQERALVQVEVQVERALGIVGEGDEDSMQACESGVHLCLVTGQLHGQVAVACERAQDHALRPHSSLIVHRDICGLVWTCVDMCGHAWTSVNICGHYTRLAGLTSRTSVD
jgi:hypothetical protein